MEHDALDTGLSLMMAAVSALLHRQVAGGLHPRANTVAAAVHACCESRLRWRFALCCCKPTPLLRTDLLGIDDAALSFSWRSDTAHFDLQ